MARFYVTERLSEHIGETPEGFLICKDVPLTRIGEFDYTAAEVPVEGGLDGVVKIQRDEDEVFSERAIASFEGKPLVINHPDGVVTPENWKNLSHGYVQNVRRGDGEMEDMLLGDILVTTKEAIDLVKSGLREVSLGYDAEYEQIEKGRGRQSNIVGNHVALVNKGRAGSRCAIQDEDSVNNNIIITREDVNTMRPKELFKRIFPKSRFADSLEDADLGEPTSVEGADDAEKAQQAAAEAKEAAEKAVAAAEEASAAAQAVSENKPTEVEETEGGEEEVGDQEGGATGIEEISARLDKIENLIQRLFDLVGEDSGGSGEMESQTDSEAKLDEEKEDGLFVEDEDEREEGWEEEEEEFQEVAGDAEIIDPDIVLSKPTGDNAAYYNRVRRTALSNALTGDHAATIYPLLKGKDIKALKPAELKGVFVAASRMIAATRDSKVQKKSFDSKGYFRQTSSEIAKIAARNKEFWKK